MVRHFIGCTRHKRFGNYIEVKSKMYSGIFHEHPDSTNLALFRRYNFFILSQNNALLKIEQLLYAISWIAVTVGGITTC
jgi:hypothetical protein